MRSSFLEQASPPVVSVYGLRTHVDFALEKSDSRQNIHADVTVHRGTIDRPPSGSEEKKGGCYFFTADTAYLYWEEVGAFCVRGGKEIIIDLCSSADEQTLRHYIFGAVFGVLLHQRKLLVLHASCVLIENKAVAFLGSSGGGKSTLAATFSLQGHPVLSDDVTPVYFHKGFPTILPGVSQLKLWPDTAEALGLFPETLPQLHPQIEKRVFQARETFSLTAIPLKRLYILAAGSHPEIEPIRSQNSLVEIIRHSFCVRLLSEVGWEHHFLQCANLIKEIPVRYLKTQRSFEALPAIVHLIKEDLSCDA